MKPLYIKKNGTVHKVAGVGMPSVYPAGNVSYDNTTSGLTADDSQSAIDELANSVADKADKDGSYSTLTAGQILVNNNLLTTDKTPFLTRQTLNPTGFSGYVREKLIGGSYAWNQLVENGNFASTDGWNVGNGTLSTSGSVLSYTITGLVGSYTNGRITRSCNLTSGHKILISIDVKPKYTNRVVIFAYTTTLAQTTLLLDITDNVANVWNTKKVIFNLPSDFTAIGIGMVTNTNYVVGDVIQYQNFCITDLTLAFGSTIADYLYSLTNNGGITKLRDMGCPIDKYTPYGYGLYSVKTSGKKIVGKNICDEVFEVGGIDNNTGQNNDSDTSQCRMCNYVSVLPNTTYVFTCGFGTGIRIYWYDGQKNFISSDAITNATAISPSNAHYLRIRSTGAYGNSYRHDMLVAIYSSGMDMTYEPYSSTTYSLGNDELRGKFDLVNGEIVASGDVKESNGEITRVRKRIELNSLAYTYDSSNQRFISTTIISDVGGDSTGGYYNNIICTKYVNKFANEDKVCFIYSNKNLYIYDYAYTDPTAFKNSLVGVYLEYDLATPTTEQSTPFADPMSMVGATTEEYIDTRDIPCPVGHETGYYGIGTEGFSMPPAPKNMDNIYKLYYSKNGYGFIPDDFKSKTFSYKYTGATVADTQYNVQNAKVNVFGLESKDTIIGMSIYMSMGDTACNFSTPVYNKNSNMFIFKPSDSNASYLTFDGVVFYR